MPRDPCLFLKTLTAENRPKMRQLSLFGQTQTTSPWFPTSKRKSCAQKLDFDSYHVLDMDLVSPTRFASCPPSPAHLPEPLGGDDDDGDHDDGNAWVNLTKSTSSLQTLGSD